MGVIPNPKMAFIFPISCILALISPILIKYFPKCEVKIINKITDRPVLIVNSSFVENITDWEPGDEILQSERPRPIYSADLTFWVIRKMNFNRAKHTYYRTNLSYASFG